MFDELRNSCRPGMIGGFLPGMKQIANVAALPGIVGRSVGLPDVHSGYGFAIGNMAAFDLDDANSIVSPGGVGFDINCGVRLLRTNLFEKDLRPVQVEIVYLLYYFNFIYFELLFLFELFLCLVLHKYYEFCILGATCPIIV